MIELLLALLLDLAPSAPDNDGGPRPPEPKVGVALPSADGVPRPPEPK